MSYPVEIWLMELTGAQGLVRGCKSIGPPFKMHSFPSLCVLELCSTSGRLSTTNAQLDTITQ